MRQEEINAELKHELLKHCRDVGNYSCEVPSLRLVRRVQTNEIRVLYTPIIGLTVQGLKRTVIGNKEYCYGANSSLILGIDMPSISHVLEASENEPFLALSVDLNRNIVADFINQIPSSVFILENNMQSAVVANCEARVMEIFLRLIKLLDNKQDIPFLAHLYIKELHYRFLMGPHGAWLSSLCSLGTIHNRISQAVSFLRNNFQQPVAMDKLAQDVGMSASSFYKYFKQITSYSPLQFQKAMRLYSAQKMLLSKECDVATAAYNVGYESTTQFIREYKRLFGAPPYKDTHFRVNAANLQ